MKFDWVGLLKQTRFADKAECLAQVFAAFTPETISPTAIGNNPCQEDIFQILEEVHRTGQAVESVISIPTVTDFLPTIKKKRIKEN